MHLTLDKKQILFTILAPLLLTTNLEMGVGLGSIKAAVNTFSQSKVLT